MSAIDPAPLIILEKVAVRLADHRVLEDLNWQINLGEHWVIQGPNGAGKTTLAKTLMGQTAVVAGSIRRPGLPLTIDDPQATGSAYAPQPFIGDKPRTKVAFVSPEQYHHLYAREQRRAQMRSFSGRIHEETSAAQALALADAASRYPNEIADLAAKPIEALSSGELRTLLIVRAMAAVPHLLILDEPFNGLDPFARQNIIRLLNLCRDAGTQMVLITHRDTDIPDFFSHGLYLAQGRIVSQGPLTKEIGPSKAIDAMETAGPTPSRERGGHHATDVPMIQMRDITVKYGDTIVLDRISWEMMAGENWAIIGPNGAGKTTLLRLITGENLQGYANNLTLFGQPKGSGESIWEIKHRIGQVADDLQARYQRTLTGLEVVCSGFYDSVGLYAAATVAQQKISRDWLTRLDIRDLAHLSMTRLSFGQQRLLLIARAMVKDPRLLILDEPCNGLDPDHRRRVLQALDIIALGGHTNLLYVTHRPDEMPAGITHHLELKAGRVHRIKKSVGRKTPLSDNAKAPDPEWDWP